MAARKTKTKDSGYYKAVVVDENGKPVDPPTSQKVKGAAQMVAGTALTAVGIPMLILPGPGAMAVVSGAAIASKGHRNLTGRDPIPLEEFVDASAARLSEVAKEDMREIGQKAKDKAPEVRAAVAEGASKAASVGTKAAITGATAARNKIAELAEKRKQKNQA